MCFPSFLHLQPIEVTVQQVTAISSDNSFFRSSSIPMFYVYIIYLFFPLMPFYCQIKDYQQKLFTAMVLRVVHCAW